MKPWPKYVLLSLFLATACQPGESSRLKGTSESSVNLSVSPEALNEESFWSYFTGVSSDVTYNGYIKFSIELDAEGRFQSLIWHPSTFSYHADYLTTLAAYQGLSSAQIDAISLHGSGRKLLLGTALAVKDELYSNEEWDFQFVSEDPLSAELVAKAMKAVAAHLPKATEEKSFYLPAPAQLAYAVQQSASFEAAGVKIASRQTIADRVCYAGGWGAGYIKKLTALQLADAVKKGTIHPDEILVLESLPRELPEVAGIIISTPSSPSSHPALLAQMLGIPFFYEKDAMTSEVWTRYENSREPIFIEAKTLSGQGCEILVRDGQSLTKNDVSRLRLLKKPKPLTLAPYDHAFATAPVSLDKLGMNDGNKVGAKAANVAELRKIIPNNSVDDSLALPLSSFARFIETASYDGHPLKPDFITLLYKLQNANLPLAELTPVLSQLRNLIEISEFPPELADEILNGIEAHFPKGTRIKLRSSSNVEDLPEFNGAGLYESKGACVGDDRLEKGGKGLCEKNPDEVLIAIKKVWASLYNIRAWTARRTFSIDESEVGMGVLIQRSFQDEEANGVAIVQYPESAYFGDGNVPDIEVISSGFPGEDDSVANPPADKIPETIRLQKEYTEVLVASSEVPRGQKLLSDAANKSLYELSEKIYRHYEKAKNPLDRRAFILDLEWKLIRVDGQERIAIKQVRPVPAPSQSTQGLGIGTVIIGEKSSLLCPTVAEDPDALSKLKLSFPIKVSVGLHEFSLSDSGSLASPFRSLSVEGRYLSPKADSRVTYSDWTEEWGTSGESRNVTLHTEFEDLGVPYTLLSTVKQTRNKHETRKLLDGVRSFWTLDFALLRDGKQLPYVSVVGKSSCESDSYQGLTPGAYNASLSYAQDRKPPVEFLEHYASKGSRPAIEVKVAAKTSFQGFDKTRFLGIDRVEIQGILSRALVLEQGSAVYAPAHHNFQWSYAFDLQAALGLSTTEEAELRAKNIRYLIIENPGESFGEMPGFPGPFGSIEREIARPDVKILIYGVSESGERTDFGEVKLVSATNLYPHL